MSRVPPGAARLLQGGLRRAETALSRLVGLPVRIAVERMEQASPWELGWLLASSPEEEVVGIYVGFAGDLSGHCLLLLDTPSAHRLGDRLLEGCPVPEEVRDTLRDSALQEWGNVAVSGVVNGIADAGGWRIRVSPPQLVRDMMGALVGSMQALAGAEGREWIAVRGRLQVGASELEGALLLMPDARTLGRLAAGRAGSP